MSRREHIASGTADASELAPGVHLRPLVGRMCGAQGLFTALADVAPGAELAYHTHPCAEAMVLLSGSAEAIVAGRRYVLNQYDALLVPPEVPHSVRSLETERATTIFAAFASDAPERKLVDPPKAISEHSSFAPGGSERVIAYFADADEYELATGALFRDLFVGRQGCHGICGGYGIFQPGSALPCHTHEYDESITIIQGRAICQVAGARYELSNCDTACVPQGRPHRFINGSPEPMAMIWVYAGDKPDRVILSQSYCDGSGCE